MSRKDFTNVSYCDIAEDLNKNSAGNARNAADTATTQKSAGIANPTADVAISKKTAVTAK